MSTVAVINEPVGSIARQRQNVVAVVGNGPMGRALAARLVEAGLAVVVGSSTRDTKGYNLPCPVESIAEAVEEAHVVFLAVPDYAHLLVMNAADFSNRVVVDVSNRRERRSYGKSIAECLRDAWSEHHQRCVVVKAFNTVSAYHLQWHARGRSVFIAGDSAAAKAQVASLAESMGFTTADVGGLMSARKLEDIPHRLFPRWGVAGLMALVTFAAWLVYNILWYHVWSYGSANPFLPDEPLFSYQQLPAKTINGAVAMSAASLLSLVFLATAVARVWQMCRRDFDAAFPRWLAGWLACRKEIGLLGALLACVHVVISLALLDPWYYPSLYRFVGLVQSSAGRPLGPASLANRPLLTKWGESFVLSGSVALLLLALAAACSIPSVAAGLSWREADLVLSKATMLALLAVSAHALLYFLSFEYCSMPAVCRVGFEAWTAKWPFGGVPPISFIAALFTFGAILARVLANLGAQALRALLARRAHARAAESKGDADARQGVSTPA